MLQQHARDIAGSCTRILTTRLLSRGSNHGDTERERARLGHMRVTIEFSLVFLLKCYAYPTNIASERRV